MIGWKTQNDIRKLPLLCRIIFWESLIQIRLILHFMGRNWIFFADINKIEFLRCTTGLKLKTQFLDTFWAKCQKALAKPLWFTQSNTIKHCKQKPFVCSECLLFSLFCFSVLLWNNSLRWHRLYITGFLWLSNGHLLLLALWT